MKRHITPVVAELRQRRKRLRLSQRAVGERAGYSANNIWSWEAGRDQPSIKRLMDWAEALGMQLTIKEMIK